MDGLVTIPTRYIDQVTILQSSTKVYVFHKAPQLADTIVMPTRRFNFSNDALPTLADRLSSPASRFPLPVPPISDTIGLVTVFQLNSGGRLSINFTLPKQFTSSVAGRGVANLAVLHTSGNSIHQVVYRSHSTATSSTSLASPAPVHLSTSKPIRDETDRGSMTIDATTPSYALSDAVDSCDVQMSCSFHNRPMHLVFVASDSLTAVTDNYGVVASRYDSHGKAWIYGTFGWVRGVSLMVLFVSMITTCCCGVSVMDVYRGIRSQVSLAAAGYAAVPGDEEALLPGYEDDASP
ncbi:hypothetical protein HK101_003975 [Irineochytrium annulatum]|nr:hypothetical protein HK101_003975 [Irineochytrium annulatum]